MKCLYCQEECAYQPEYIQSHKTLAQKIDLWECQNCPCPVIYSPVEDGYSLTVSLSYQNKSFAYKAWVFPNKEVLAALYQDAPFISSSICVLDGCLLTPSQLIEKIHMLLLFS